MTSIKAIVAWVVIVGLVIFAVTNFHVVRVDLTIAVLEAPLSYVIALAAIGGALGGEAIVTAFRWATRPRGGD
jgi:uncharacterized integral membrane protein